MVGFWYKVARRGLVGLRHVVFQCHLVCPYFCLINLLLLSLLLLLLPLGVDCFACVVPQLASLKAEPAPSELAALLTPLLQ